MINKLGTYQVAWKLLLLAAWGLGARAPAAVKDASRVATASENPMARPTTCPPQIAIAAKEHNVPVYVAAESYKFARWAAHAGSGSRSTVQATRNCSHAAALAGPGHLLAWAANLCSSHQLRCPLEP